MASHNFSNARLFELRFFIFITKIDTANLPPVRGSYDLQDEREWNYLFKERGGGLKKNETVRKKQKLKKKLKKTYI